MGVPWVVDDDGLCLVERRHSAGVYGLPRRQARPMVAWQGGYGGWLVRLIWAVMLPERTGRRRMAELFWYDWGKQGREEE